MRMSPEYTIEVLDRPGLTLQPAEIVTIQSELCRLGALCFDPLPIYQVFDTSSKTIFNDKILVLARQGTNLIAFVSAVILPIRGHADPTIHTGLTTIHPEHRKSGVIHTLFGNLFLHLFSVYPNGVWLSTLARVITSLAHIAKYTINVYPSPQWAKETPSRGPSETHLQIAREISTRHRVQIGIPPAAELDEQTFVFKGTIEDGYSSDSSDWRKDADDPRYWHREESLTKFYRLLLSDQSNEVLQISYLDPAHALKLASTPRFRGQFYDRLVKVNKLSHRIECGLSTVTD